MQRELICQCLKAGAPSSHRETPALWTLSWELVLKWLQSWGPGEEMPSQGPWSSARVSVPVHAFLGLTSRSPFSCAFSCRTKMLKFCPQHFPAPTLHDIQARQDRSGQRSWCLEALQPSSVALGGEIGGNQHPSLGSCPPALEQGVLMGLAWGSGSGRPGEAFHQPGLSGSPWKVCQL